MIQGLANIVEVGFGVDLLFYVFYASLGDGLFADLFQLVFLFEEMLEDAEEADSDDVWDVLPVVETLIIFSLG